MNFGKGSQRYTRYAWWCVALLALPVAAQATGFDMTTGPSVTAGERTTAAAFASAFRDGPSNHFVRLEPIGTVGWIDSRSTHRDNLNHAVFVAGGGVRILAGKHWFASEQLAATDTRTNALSSRFEFMTSAGWQYRHFIVMVRHISNGRIVGGGRNMGETMLLAGLRW